MIRSVTVDSYLEWRSKPGLVQNILLTETKLKVAFLPFRPLAKGGWSDHGVLLLNWWWWDNVLQHSWDIKEPQDNLLNVASPVLLKDNQKTGKDFGCPPNSAALCLIIGLALTQSHTSARVHYSYPGSFWRLAHIAVKRLGICYSGSLL